MKKLALVLAALFLLTGAASAATAPGALDPSFGDDGRVFADREEVGVKVAQTDDKIYVLVGRRLVAYEPNGAPDLAFGEGGGVSLSSVIPYNNYLTVDSQGRPVVAAQAWANGVGPGLFDTNHDTNLVVFRFLPDGHLDPSFGEGGVVVTNLGLPRATLPPGAGSDYTQSSLFPQDVAIDRFDRVVVTGSYAVRLQSGKQQLIVDYAGFAARLQPNGDVDHTFGSNGVTVGFAPAGLRASALAPDGSLFVSASFGEVGRIVQIDSDGDLDPDFGDSGRSRVALEPNADLIVDGRGRLVVADTDDEHVVLVRRLLASGQLDRTFGNQGDLRTRFTKGGRFTAAIIAGDRAGGYSLAMSQASPGGNLIRNVGFLLAHVTREGRIDRDFGRIRTGFGRRTSVDLESISVDTRGRPLLAGSAKSPMFAGHHGLVMARYRPAE